MMRLALAGLILFCSAAQAAHQDWQVSRQPDRNIDRVMMEAWADADTSPARMAFYCDTENGFRVMILPHRALVPEGPARLVLTIDGAKPITLTGDAFGDDETDVVTIHDAARIQRILSGAHHIAVHIEGTDRVAEDAFTFGDLVAQRPMLMKICPVSN